jgi:4-amino-4-deoxy-L-arabinose transferase-like glycosyltransferase
VLANVGSEMRFFRDHRVRIVALLFGFAVVSVCYAVWIPAGEGVDEVAHFEYIRYLKEQRGLPVQPTEPGETLSVWMGHHPPLYYALNAILLAGQDTSHSDRVFRANPHFTWAENDGANGWNVMVHSGQDRFPGRGVIRAFFIVRLLGIVYGLITLFALYQATRCEFPEIGWLPFLATAVIAFNPSFIYMSSTVHHDILLAMWFALGAWWMMGYNRKRSTYSAVLAGILVGCAILTKISGVVLGLGVASVLVGRAIRERDWSAFWRDGLVAGGVAALLAGWWFVRNRVLYGDLLGWRAYSYVFHANLRPEPSLLLGLKEFFLQTSHNFWGGFGFMHITFPAIGRFFWIASAIVLVGWAVLWVRDRGFLKQHVLALLVAAVLLLGITGVYLRLATINLGAGHGRYLFPAAFSIGILLSVGVLGLVGPRKLKWVSIAISMGLFAYALWLPVTHLLPKYAPPETVDALPSTAHATHQELGPGVYLVGYQMSTDAALVPGMGLEAMLYWQADTSVDAVADPFLEITLESPDGKILSSSQGWPTPSLPPDRWPEGKVVATSWDLYVPEMELPGVIELKAKAGREAESDTVLIAELLTAGGATETDPAELPGDLKVLFGDDLLLRGYELSTERAHPGETVAVTLFWQVESTPATDHTVFVHLLDESGQLVAQLDRPAGGAASPSSTWRAGQAWRDSYPVPLPADLPGGVYTLQVGMYDWPSLDRVPIAGTGQTTWPLGEVQVAVDG